jgi:ParB/RepB/Spo0J family partition protein
MFSIKRGNVVSTVKSVLLEEIDFDDAKFRSRLEVSESHLRTLMRSIEERGLQNLPKLLEADGQYIIIAGWSRLLAVRELGRSEVTADVYENISDKEAMLISSSDNLHRENLTDLEISNQIHVLRKTYKIPAKTIIELLGGKEQRYIDLLRLQVMDEKLRISVHKGILPLYAAVELHKFPERARAEYMDKAILEQWSVRKIKMERKLLHPFKGIYTQEDQEASQGWYHALKYVRYPETESLMTNVWKFLHKHDGISGPHKCELTDMIRAQDNDPPYVCDNDVEWVVVAKGRVDPRGRDVARPSENIQEWPAWAFLCGRCTELVFPSMEYHENTPFIIAFKNVTGQIPTEAENTLNV